MATVHKCDVCKKAIGPNEGADVSVSAPYARFEFCDKHAAPILKALKNYKLIRPA
jgi:hypothetical protein